MTLAAADDLVSVIIPAYNAERYVRSALNSALAQTYQQLEVLVVDDGSSDGTAAIVAAVAARDGRVQLWRQSNRGVAAARNCALARAKGTLIAPLDADDLWHPEKLARQVAVMRQSPAVGLVYAWSSTIDELGHVIERCACTARQEGMVYPTLVLDNFIGPASAPLIRRASLIEVGGYDTTLVTRAGAGCEDYQVNLAIAERYALAVVPEFLIGYRLTGSAMSQHVRQMKRSYDAVMKDVRHRHPELPGRLFRWSEGNFCLYLGAKCLLGGHSGGALPLLPGALRGDWAFLIRPKVRRVLSSALRRKSRHQSFLDLPSGPTSTDRLAAGTRERRRERLAASLRIDRPTDR
jgi:glycosyltransferase involved in cell wall biosynthesis